MRVLVLTHPESDHGAAQLMAGLVDLLGQDNVIDAPWHRPWHQTETVHYGQDPTPELDGIFSHWEGVTSAYPHFPYYDSRHWTLEEVYDRIHEFDLIIGGVRACSVKVAKLLHKRFGDGLAPIALACHEDRSDSIQPGVVEDVQPTWIFKREISGENVGYKVPTFPLPFSCILPLTTDPVPVEKDRPVDVFFSFSMSNRDRGEVARNLHGFNGIIGENVAWREEYSQGLGESKIGISAAGHGWDTVRFWECGFFGAALVADKTPLRIPNPFTHGVNYVCYDELDPSKEVRKLLADDEERIRIAEAGQRHLLTYHTCTERARYLLNCVGISV